jgi:hypothetical protein
MPNVEQAGSDFDGGGVQAKKKVSFFFLASLVLCNRVH